MTDEIRVSLKDDSISFFFFEQTILAKIYEKGDKGDRGEQGPAGQDGYTPVKGVDYFTSSEIAEIVSQSAQQAASNVIDDSSVTQSKTWSASKLNSMFGTFISDMEDLR